MDNHNLVIAANDKVIQKRGGNLCAPLPRGSIGKCGYLNELTNDKINETLDAYKQICAAYPRQGHGVDMHCHDVGLANPAARAQDAFKGIGGSSCCDSSDSASVK